MMEKVKLEAVLCKRLGTFLGESLIASMLSVGWMVTTALAFPALGHTGRGEAC